MSTSLPSIYTCSSSISNVNYVDIDYSTLGLNAVPSVTATANSNVNIFISDKTNTTARINFSQKFIGTVYYTVIGFK